MACDEASDHDGVVDLLDGVFSVAFDAAHAGAIAIKEVAGRGIATVREGSGGPLDVVTNADLASETAIINVIRDRRPSDALLSEESGEVAGISSIRWIIDPLDGTTNFLHGLSYYAVSVAAEAEGRTIAAVVYEPAREMWLGVSSDGVSGGGRTVGVRSCGQVSRALLSFAVPYDGDARRAAYQALSGVAPAVHDLRNLGSTACDLAAVTAGEIDGFIGFGQAAWDTAAGLALVEAAGGTTHSAHTPSGQHVVIAGSVRLVEEVVPLLCPGP